jgi:hypothetical protein
MTEFFWCYKWREPSFLDYFEPSYYAPIEISLAELSWNLKPKKILLIYHLRLYFMSWTSVRFQIKWLCPRKSRFTS